MKRVLAISHLSEDVQLESVEEQLKLSNTKVIKLLTNSFRSLDLGLKSSVDGVELFVDGVKFVPDVVWYATHPRTDSLYCRGYRFPGEHRSAATQFIVDLHYALDSKVKWVPGSFDSISRSDSKPILLHLASSCGLEIPNVTINGNLDAKTKILDERLYKKKLGFPTVVSFDKRSGVEVITTTTNHLGNRNAGKEVWQWQSPVESVAHVRCCLVEDQLWSVVWHRKSPLKRLYDYRSQQYCENWQQYILPSEVTSSVLRLAERLRIKIACPEFLVTCDGTHVFIDMNPCGDWAGFFNETTNREISKSISQLLLK